jgi:hypothetical protein
MASVPSTKIEEKAVRAVCDAIDLCPLLKANIKLDDKGISWDGEISLYNNVEQKKSQLAGVLPAQVKGKTVKSFSGKNRSYPIEISDIKNYLIKKGVIFFVVEMNASLSECRIYYSTLLPVDLLKLLEDIKSGQKTVSANLKYIPDNRYSQFQHICRYTIDNMALQWSEKYIDLNEIGRVGEFEFLVPHDGNGLGNIFENEVYGYGRYDEKCPWIPLKNKIIFTQVVRSYPKKISVNGKEYYSEYKGRFERNNKSTVLLGKGVEIIFDKDAMHMNIKFRGSIEERIKDAEFYLDTVRTGEVSIDGRKTKYNFHNTNKNKESIENVERYLQFLIKARKTLNYFGVSYNKDFSDIYTNDNANLDWFIKYVDGSKKHNPNINNTGKYYVDIGPLRIGIFAFVNDDGTVEVYNMFGDFYKTIKTTVTLHDGREVVVSPYLFMKTDEIDGYANFNKDAVYDSINVMGLNEDLVNDVTLFLLEIIKAYDKDPSRKEFLILAESIQDLLDNDSTCSNINKINRLQLIKRQRALTKGEKLDLIGLRNSETDNLTLCAISILLENESDYEFYYDKLTEEERDQLKSFPIYNLRAEAKNQLKTG